MRFVEFRIRRYRAIEEANVGVSNNLIPLIGVNESGKTTVLQAILAFDQNGDKFGGGQHLVYKNRYETEDHECRIEALVSITADDLAALAGTLGLQPETDLFKELKECAAPGRTFRLVRHLHTDDKHYTVEDIEAANELPAHRGAALAHAIYQALPFILYFDDFTDRVPEVVKFRRATNQRGYNLTPGPIAQWQRVIEEIVIRATRGRWSLETFLKIEDGADRRGVLSDINDELEQQIMATWRELKRWSPALGDDAGDLDLEMSFDPGTEDGTSFEFGFIVEDRSTERARYFKVSERSKGFQWYFNFLMRLRFNPKYQEDATGAIYLLDEPGSYLHASAQEELLKELEEISNTNTILYCTHSQHLLDPAVVNIGQARIIAKNEGIVSLIPFGDVRTRDYQGALTPIFEALHLRSGAFGKRVKKALITEGITEFYLIGMLIENLDDWSFDEIDILPGAGVDQLRDLISFALAFADDFIVLLDSDRPGLAAKRKYEQFFEDALGSSLRPLQTSQQATDVVLEDLLSETDQDRLKALVDSVDTKGAIVRLRFADSETKRAFFEDLDATTHDRLAWLKSLLSELHTKAK